MTECSGPNCKDEIVWVTTKEGKPHPCNPAIKRILTKEGVFVSGWESHWST